MSAPTATNSNCLEGLACPHCKQQEGFNIASEVIAHTGDDGVVEYRETEWSEGNAIWCWGCQKHGTVEQFTVQKGDVLLSTDEVWNLIEQAGYGISYWADEAEIDEEAFTYRVVEADDDDSQGKTLTHTQIRRAFNDLRAAGYMPDFVEQEIAEDDICLDAEVGDRVIKWAMFGQLVYG